MRKDSAPAGEATISYRYLNASPAAVDLWLARPPECCTQDQVRVTRQNRLPIATLEAAGNLIDQFRLPAWRGLAIDWRWRRLRVALAEEERGSAIPLCEAERSRFLAPSPQIPADPRLADEARRILAGAGKAEGLKGAGGAEGQRQAARLFFDALVSDYRYAHPVPRRGALDMLAARRGDCGQFTSLFVALCRAAGIPARPMVGALLTPWMTTGHVWAEIWLEDAGWIPVDPSRGQALAAAGTGDSRGWFGGSPGDCFCFSSGMDLELGEAYGPPVRPATLPALLRPRVAFAGRPLRWGFETRAGLVPYLQPAYPRCASGLSLGALTSYPAAGHWTAGTKRLPWMALHGVLEQNVLLLALILLAVGFLLGDRVPSAAELTLLALSLLVAAIIGLRLWLTGALARRFRRR